MTVFGKTIIILNSAELAVELMDTRGSKYSRGQEMVFGMQMCGWTHVMSSQQYTARFRAYRQKIHKAIGSLSSILRYSSLQEMEVDRFLLRAIEDHDRLDQHLRTEAGTIILKITYGYTVEPLGIDPLVDIADQALSQFSAATIPGAWLVDTLPILQHLPDWVPGAGFKKTAALWHQTLMKMAEWPMRFARMQMANNDEVDCFVTDAYKTSKGPMSKEDEYVLKWSAASMYIAGADTVSITYTLFCSIPVRPLA